MLRPANVLSGALLLEDIRWTKDAPEREPSIVAVLPKCNKGKHDTRTAAVCVGERQDWRDPVKPLLLYLQAMLRTPASRGPVYLMPGTSQPYTLTSFREKLRGELTAVVGAERALWYSTRSLRSGGRIDYHDEPEQLRGAPAGSKGRRRRLLQSSLCVLLLARTGIGRQSYFYRRQVPRWALPPETRR